MRVTVAHYHKPRSRPPSREKKKSFAGIVYSYLGQRPEVSHINSGRRVWVVVRDAALRVLADGERAVVGPRHPRVVLVLCGADVYQSSVERRQARVADVIPVRMESLRWLNPTISQRRGVSTSVLSLQ